MDNAAKALLIAGGILLSIIVLSLFMLMLNSLTDYQQAQTQIEKNQDIVTFNNQYAGYLRDGISGYDILSIINKVTFYNRTKSSKSDDPNNVAEPITLKISFKNGNNKLLAMDGADNKLFKNNITINDTNQSVEIQNGINETEAILNTTMPELPSSSPSNITYTNEILRGLLDNYNSKESIFADNFCSDELSKEDRRKRFSNFNVIVGQAFFPLVDTKNKPIPDETIEAWWKDYFDNKKAKKLDGKNRTIREELSYYYEYKQFQRGKFNYIVNNSKPTYSSETGRIVNMEFEFTGEFI